MYKIIFITIIIFLFIDTFYADISDIKQTTVFDLSGAYYPGNQQGYGINGGFAPVSYNVLPKSGLQHRTNDPGRDLGYPFGRPQIGATISHIFILPFLNGKGPLFSDNNLEFKFDGVLSPVSVNSLGEIIWTPIAVFKLSSGFGIGTGWNLIGFDGLGRNIPSAGNNAPLSEPFSGAVYKFWSSFTFQFDLGAIMPGKWTHIVVVTVSRFEYRAFTLADADTPWQYEADEGENLNGWKYYGTYLAGYKMPLIVDFIGFLIKSEEYIDSNRWRSTISSGGWGSDFVTWNFGPLVNFHIAEKSWLTLLVQFKTGKQATDSTIGNRFYQYWQVKGSYLYFNGIAFDYGFQF